MNCDSDFETVKAIMACSHMLDESDSENTPENEPYIVAVLHGHESISESRVAGRSKKAVDRLELLSLNEVLARIMVHTSRQPGLSDVFTELFNYQDDEFYIFDEDPSFGSLYGRSIAEINHYLQLSYAVGVKKREGSIELGPPREIRFEEGDSLIVLKENSSPLQVSEKPARKMALVPEPFEVRRDVNVLIIGAQPILVPILYEYANYLHSGSSVCIADVRADEALELALFPEVSLLLEDCGIELIRKNVDASRQRQLEGLLEEYKPDCVLVLSNDAALDADAEDERILRTLLYLREYRGQKGVDFSITCEMLLTQDKELAAAIEPDDFIIGRQLSALLMAQISEKRELASLFEILLPNDGLEVYLKPASRYVPLGEPIDLVSASESAADKDEVFIGIRQKVNGRYAQAEINPSKYVSDMQTLRQYVFGKDDYFVVLAEDNRL